MLDDAPNLRSLAEISAPLTWEKIYDFVVTAGEASSPTLRPISMVSFALQYSSWPSHPDHFKLINILIHLACGCFVYLIAHKLASLALVSDRYIPLMAAWSAAFWLLHPINVSTVLYVVQRMAMLAAMFTFASVWLYLIGREHLYHSREKLGYLLISAAVIVSGSLALLSKENGALVPLLLLVVECTFLLKYPVEGKLWQVWKCIFLWVPTTIILSYLIFQGFAGSNPQRSFTTAERILTQFRVLIDYLEKIFFPRPKAFGLYFDDYQKSVSIFQPISTLLTFLALTISLFFAFLLRYRFPAFAFAVLWYFGGHAIESTTIQLELYFEHRNYLPLAGIAIALPYVILTSRGEVFSKGIVAGGTIFLLILSSLTFTEVQLWSNPMRQAILWGMEKPGSMRARAVMASMYDATGNRKAAYHEYMRMAEDFKDSAGPLSDVMLLLCQKSTLPLLDLDVVKKKFATASFSLAPINNIILIVEAMEAGKCDGLSHEFLGEAIHALLSNPIYMNPKLRSHLYFYLARLHASAKQLAPAIAYAEKANELEPNAYVAIREAEWLVDAGFFREALSKLDSAEKYAGGSYLKKRIFANGLARDKAALAKYIQENPNSK